MNENFELGQHFLVDKNVLKKEIEVANLSLRDKVLEIGCGTGFLTKELLKKSGEVFGFEIDKNCGVDLKKIKTEKLKIIFDNALNYSWRGYNKIVSNIPYYLSEGIIKKACFEEIDELVLIVGENFKKNLEENEKLSGVLANVFYDIKIIEKINKNSFVPIPRVNSFLIKMKRKPLSDLQKFVLYFFSKSGKIKNILISYYLTKGFTKNQAREKLKDFNLPERILDKPGFRITGRVFKKILSVSFISSSYCKSQLS